MDYVEVEDPTQQERAVYTTSPKANFARQTPERPQGGLYYTTR